MPWREKATTPGYPCFRAAPIGGLSRRQGGGRDNGKKELPSDPPAVAAVAWPWPLPSRTPHKQPRASTLVEASNWAAPDWGQGAKRHQRKEPRQDAKVLNMTLNSLKRET